MTVVLERTTDLALRMPQVDAYLEAQDIGALVGQGASMAGLAPAVTEVLSSQPGLHGASEERVAEALRSLTQAAIGVVLPPFSGGAALRFAERAPAEGLLAALGFSARLEGPPGAQRFVTEGDPSHRREALWFPADLALLVGDHEFIERALAVALGSEPPLATEPRFLARRAEASNPRGLTGNGDFSRLGVAATPQGISLRAPWKLKLLPPPASTLVAELPVDGGLAGRALALPTKLDLAARLPSHTLAYVAFSSRGSEAPAERFQSLLDAAASLTPDTSGIAEVLKDLSLSGGELLGTVGSQGVLALVLDPTLDRALRVEDRLGVVLLQELTTPRAVATLTGVVERLGRKASHHVVKRAGGAWRAVAKDPKGRKPSALVAFEKTTAFVGVGNLRVLERSLEAMRTGTDALGPLGAGDGRERLASLLVHPTRIASLLDERERGMFGEATVKALEAAPPLALHYSGDGEGQKRSLLRVELSGAALLGTFSAVAASGFRRYVASAKTAEAKNTVRAMARAAVAAFEREDLESGTAIRRFCGSADPVPRDVPRRTTYTPRDAPGLDFNGGDRHRDGWSCLRFSYSNPIRYRYAYRVGSGYLGPARGGPDPGPTGFEVSAEGDLDGDGKTSLFTVVGQEDPVAKSIVLSKTFVADEYE